MTCKHRLPRPRVNTVCIAMALIYGMGNALLYGTLVQYADELKYPHTVLPEFQFGTCGAKAGELNDPQGVCVGAGGEIYIADTSNNRIQVFSKAGQLVRTWGEAGGAPGQFIAPQAI